MAHPEIETVQRAGADSHQYFAGPDDRFGRIDIFKDSRAAVLLKLDRFHFPEPDFLEGSSPARTVAASSPPQSHGRLT